MEKELNAVKKAEEFIQLFKKGEEFTKELLKENERLRYRIAQLEEALARSGDEARIKLYKERISALEEELNSLKERYARVEAENKDFAEKYLEVEQQNCNLPIERIKKTAKPPFH
ncbi:MAG: hypothetical protein ACK4TF_05655 [Thermodesulfovibrionales bacterium]